MDHKTDSERAAFESWIKKDCGDLSTFGSGVHQHYRNSAVNNAWDGWKARASLAASAGSEPVAGAVLDDDGLVCRIRHGKEREYIACRGGRLLYTHPSPPEGAGWRPIASFSEDEADELLAWKPELGRIMVTWLPDGHPDAEEGEGWHEAWSHKRVRGITHACIPPAPPASEAKGA